MLPDIRPRVSAAAATALAACVALACAAPTTARAAATGVYVTDLGQPGMVSSVGQRPLWVAARGTCSDPLDGAQANGGPAACPAGTWPAMGVEAWQPVVEVAGGDTIGLAFDAPVQAVRVALTDDLPIGLFDPLSMQPEPNLELLAPQPALATADPEVWSVTLPRVDRRALAFSVVASDAAGATDFAAGMTTPRWDDFATHCGTYYVNPGEAGSECSGPASPPAGGSPPVRTAVLISRVVRLRNGVARLSFTIPAAGRLRVSLRSGRRRIGHRDLSARRAGAHTVAIRLSSATRRSLRRRAVSASAHVVYSARSGTTETDTFAVRLPRAP